VSKSTLPLHNILVIVFLLFLAIGAGSSDVTRDGSSELTESESDSPYGIVYTLSDTDDVTISTDTTWTTFQDLKRGIIITSGATLTISGTNVSLNNMNYETPSISVESGCALIINNSRLYTYSGHSPFQILYNDGSDGSITHSRIEDFDIIQIRSTETTAFSHAILICNNTLFNWVDRAIWAHHADEINITSNDFYNPDNNASFTVFLGDASNATVHRNRFHDYGIVNGYQGTLCRSMISVASAPNSTITSNIFERIGLESTTRAIYCMRIGSADITIESNTFRDVWGCGIQLYASNSVLSNNIFENVRETPGSNYRECPILLGRYGTEHPGSGNLVEYNTIQSTNDAGILSMGGYNHTIRYNVVKDCGGTGIQIGMVGMSYCPSNYTVYGNMVVESAIGIEMSDTSLNHTVYQNAFIANDLSARDYNHTGTSWSNGTHGNLWYPDYTGGDSTNDWFGDSPYVLDANITDPNPMFRVGDLPPGSGVWSIQKPLAYWAHDLSIPSSIEIYNSSLGALVLLNITMLLTDNPTSISLSGGTFLAFVDSNVTRGLSIDSYGEIRFQSTVIDSGSLTLDCHDQDMLFSEVQVLSGDISLSGIAGQQVEDSSASGTFRITAPNVNVTISGCLISDLDVWDHTHYLTFESCHFNTFTVDIRYCDHLVIANSTFEEYYDFNPLHCVGNHFLWLYNNTITDSDESLYFTGCPNATIELNTLSLSGGNGICYPSSTPCSDNITIINNIITGCHNAIEGVSSNAVIWGNQISLITGTGIHHSASSTSTLIAHNSISDGLQGLYLADDINGTISNNVANHTGGIGMYFTGCANSSLLDSVVLYSTSVGIYIESSEMGFSLENVTFIECQRGVVIEYCSGCSMTDLNFDSCQLGINMTSSPQCQIHDSDFSDCPAGIIAYNCTGLDASHLTFEGSQFAMRLTSSSDGEIQNCNFTGYSVGLLLVDCTNMNATGIHCQNCGTGVNASDSSLITITVFSFDTVTYGMILDGSANCLIQENNLTGCGSTGIILKDADHNTVFYNTFVNVPFGVYMWANADHNTIYFNFFNGENDYIHGGGTGNAFHNGTHGNFYWDYDGFDADGNLIGDTSYVISAGTDSLPLMVWGSWPSDDADWWVFVDTYVLPINYTLRGELRVHASSVMYIKNATIWFNCTSDFEFGLNIDPDGALYQYNGFYRALNETYRFYVFVAPGSYAYVNGTHFIDIYHIHTMSDDTYFTNLVLTNAYDAIFLQLADNVIITEITINGASHCGIRADNCVNLNITEIHMTNVDTGVILSVCANPVLTYVHVETATYGVYATGCTGVVLIQFLNVSLVNTGVRFWNGNTLVVTNMTATHVTVSAINGHSTANMTITGGNFSLYGGGMFHFELDIDWFEVRDCYGFNGSNVLRLGTSTGIMYNCEIMNFTNAIAPSYAHTTDSCNITDNYFYGCAIAVTPCGGTMRVEHNEFHYCGTIVSGLGASSLALINNTVCDADYGIHSTSIGGSLYAAWNTYTDVDVPIHLQSCGHNDLIANETISGCTTGVYLRSVENMTISDFSISGYSIGVHLDMSTNITLHNIALDTGTVGIRIDGTTLTKMRDCSIQNSDEGIVFANLWSKAHWNQDIDTSNTIESKPVYFIYNETGTTHTGLDTNHLTIAYCEFVTVNGSMIGTVDGLHLAYSNNCTVTNSTITHLVSLFFSSDNMFSRNTFNSTGTISIDSYFLETTNNTFYVNAFYSAYSFTAQHAYEFTLNRTDYGNYWFDYSGSDANEDGIGDTRHRFYATSTYISDELPLIIPPTSVMVYLSSANPLDNDLLTGIVPANVTQMLL